MTTPKKMIWFAALLVLLAASSSPLRAQTAWTSLGGDGLWNTAGNWSNGVPAVGVAALLTNNSTVNYTAPMAAASFATLDTAGRLTVSAVGFNLDAGGAAAYTGRSNSVLTVNAGGRVIITNSGSWSVTTNSIMDVEGGILIVTNNTAATAISFGPNGNQSTANAAGFTNNGGTVVFSQPFNLRGRFSRFQMTGGSLDLQGGGGITETANDQERLWLINGGTANLGNFVISRTFNGVTASTLGGLVISNGTVNATSLQVGNNASRAGASVFGGTLTNTGSFTIADRAIAASSGERRVFFYIRGGMVVSTVAQGIIVGNQSSASAAAASVYGGFLDIGGGTLYTEGITLVKDATLSNVHGQLSLSGGTIYLGSVGLMGNVGVSSSTYSVALSGGTIAAKSTSFGIGADLTFNTGSTTIQCADAANTPFDLWMTNVIAGSGTFIKTGGGKFTVFGIGTHTGTISINAGTLALEGSGALPTTGTIAVGTGATFSAGPSFTLNAGKILRGTGTVTSNITAAAAATIKVADDAVIGTLTLKNNLTELGGVKNNFDITSPSTKDLLVVEGTLDIGSGVQEIKVSAVGSPPIGTYRLIQYGSLIGDTNNLTLTGAIGYLTNNTAANAIDLVLTSERSATNLVWKGDSVLNNWDIGTTFNWTNNGSGAAFKFLPGDSVTFNNQGSVSPAVNLIGDIAPSSLTVAATVDYTWSGPAKITGLTGFTKTNSGKLAILIDTNDFTGVTTLSGGTLSVSNLSSASVESPIGAAGPSAANLLFNGGTLEYLGATKSINRSATLQAGGGTVSIFDPATVLTQNGSFTGGGGLTKIGSGQLSLNTANDYTAGTVVTAGSLRTGQGSGVNISALGTGNLTLNGTANPAAFVYGADQEVLTNLLVVTGDNNFITNNGNNTVITMTGTGTLTLEGAGGSTFTFDSDMSTFSGTIYVNTLGNPRFHPSSGSSNAVFNLGTGIAFLNNRNGLTANIGALIGGSGTQLRGASTGNNPSTYNIGGRNNNATFDGQITDGPVTARYANIVKVGTGIQTLTGTSTYTGSTVVSNGVLALTGSATIDGSRSIAVASPGALDVTGRTDGTLTVGAFVAQTLGGVGQVWGIVTNGPNGTIAPGFSIGTLIVTNFVAMQSGSTTRMEIARPTSSDKLVSPLLFLDGTLVVTNVGAILQPGDTFDLLDGTISGTFASVTLPNYYTWSTANLYVNGTISVTGVLPPPQVSSITYSGTDVTLSATGGAASGGLLVVTSANVGTPLNQWTPVLTNAFDGSGNFTSPAIPIDPAAARQFYRLLVW